LKRNERLMQLDEKSRRAFCREVLERMSELVEGEAEEEFCERVIELLGDCPCYENYQATLNATIQLAQEAAAEDSVTPAFDEERFESCVQRVREQLLT